MVAAGPASLQNTPSLAAPRPRRGPSIDSQGRAARVRRHLSIRATPGVVAPSRPVALGADGAQRTSCLRINGYIRKRSRNNVSAFNTIQFSSLRQLRTSGRRGSLRPLKSRCFPHGYFTPPKPMGNPLSVLPGREICTGRHGATGCCWPTMLSLEGSQYAGSSAVEVAAEVLSYSSQDQQRRSARCFPPGGS